MRMRAIVAMPVLALMGCQSQEVPLRQKESQALYDVAEPVGMPAAQPMQPPPTAVSSPTGSTPDTATPTPLEVAVPKMAYSYRYGFRLPEAAVARTQARHMALCDQLGPTRCQLLGMASSGGEDNAASLKLRVASAIARSFGARLSDSVSQAGGRTVTSTIAADDVSKAMVDTEARLRQRELLVARLTEILRTRQGKVAELVEAERSVAVAQEEIDQAKGWLTELRARVAMSTVDITYQPVVPSPAAARGGLHDSVALSASAFVAGLSAILQIAIYALPWALLALVGWLVARRWVPRWPGRSDDETEPLPA